ncbi:TIGR01777 family oxidoreductase [Desulfovibrio sp. JC022]|uniref:TIGR01777 family oxidoreductase n=1 Tax=Desulfovibrio sp. JC022 TaxID=2593642 RepID=UPI0013D1A433|nr:TIGR01777 family oxidoreductase [Desulfovibrio sp. JC022]NDV21739.1 TIGR01777 family protein [Desulfovibrio sp. JC022]
MRVVITGGTGFIGKSLSRGLVSKGYQVICLTRSSRPSEISGVRNVVWDGKSSSGWLEYADGADAIVNLAGDNIASGRWTAAKKQSILASRVDAGRAVSEAVTKAKVKPQVVIQGSAIGYYGSCGPEPVNENSPKGDLFLSDVVEKWEASTVSVEEHGVRRVIARTAMVLGNGGALAKMIGPFKSGLGSYLGHGHQGVSWVHIADEVRAIIFLIEKEKCHGVYNLSSIHPLTFNHFADSLGSVLGKKVRLRVPAFVLKLVMGQMAEEILLSGQFVLPERLISAGFKFNFTDAGDALCAIVEK